MADLDERLNQLISDQESMKKVLAMAKAILAQRDSATPEPAQPAAVPQPQEPAPADPAAPDVASMLAAIMANSQKGPQAPPSEAAAAPPVFSAEGGSASPLAAMLPQLMQIMSGNGNLVRSERVNLLQAMRPYLKESRLGSIDRALKMANVTKAATSAMHLLGR